MVVNENGGTELHFIPSGGHGKIGVMKIFFGGLGVLLALLGGVATAEGTALWTNRLEVTERSELAVMNLAPVNGALQVALRNPESSCVVEFKLGNRATRYALSPVDLIPTEKRERISTWPAPELKEPTCWFTLKRTEESWYLYLDDHPVARLPELWPGTLELQHAPANTPPEEELDDYTQRLGAFTFEDDFLVPAGSEFPPTWEVMTGIWKLHSVTGSVSGSSGGYQLARQPRPEKSPNFYTLEGGGTNAIVLAGEPFYSRYICRAAVQHNIGTNGLVVLAGEHGGYFVFGARTDPTSDRLILELWQQGVASDTPPEVLAAVQTELPAGQWLLLEVQTFDDRLVCRADNIEVLRYKHPLPPGGRFGLFSNMPDGETTRFDDVAVKSHSETLFDAPEDVAFATRRKSSGMQALQYKGTTWLYFPPVAPASTNFWEYGAAHGDPLRQESMFLVTSNEYSCALAISAAEGDAPEYRFTCHQNEGQRTYTLELHTATNSVVLDSVSVAFSSNRVTLAIDALRTHELRCYADGKLVCFDRPTEQPSGVWRVYAATGDDLFFTAPQIASHDTRMSERFEKNPLYVNDPYMRHWASPEGQWITFKDGMTWFKGDITGAVKVRMPIVNGMELHLCIPEGSSNGTCRVAVSDNTIAVYSDASSTNAAFTVAAEVVPEISFDKKQVRLFTVGLEDGLLWLGGDDTLLAKTHLPEVPQGRRMRISGMAMENLSQTLVKRENLFDTLFTESLYNWTINGGRWEVINRFYCEPTWSHMNGESADSLAALWSKYVFSGDFSIEFYAGMRMGWYERPGDLNLSVMSKSNSTGDGYTAIATGWDPDHSQLYSRLLRNGAAMDISTKYLVPRSRAGLVRQGYQPLVAGGRDIHGAWYGMQLRRIGKRLQYIYDNEPVFDVEDEEPLQDGSLGIWTYRNSMMVARIKIAAQSIKPRPFAFHAIAPELVAAPEVPATDYGIYANERTVQPLTPQYWSSFDTVSHPSVRFSNLDSAQPEMRVTSILGAGSFLVQCNLPPVQPEKLLGWRFEIARHPQALVNFEFTTVKDDGKGNLAKVQGWTYILSGTDETRGQRLICGALEELPPSEGSNVVWTAVEVWVPADVIHAKLPVQIEGFGNLQPSDVQMGLKGNPPHAWYAIRNFREIHRGVPTLTAPPEKRVEIAALAQKVNSLPPGELQMMEVPVELDPRRPVIEWAVPELANFGLRTEADSTIPGSILITTMHPWPSPMLPPKRVMADAQPAPFEMEGNNVRVLVPYSVLQPNRMTLAVELADGRSFRQVVTMRADAAVNHPPVLLSLELPEGGLETFEERPGNAKQYQSGAIASIDTSDPSRGGVLKFSNSGIYGRRLNGQLVKSFNWIATPLLQFRYKGDPMAIVAMSYGNVGFTFSEVYNAHVRFGERQAAVVDDTWRVWTVMPADGIGAAPLAERTAILPAPIKIGSRHDRDQTGLHSSICFDDVACGPAVGPNRPFAFKAEYADSDTVAEVAYAILSGQAAYDNCDTTQQAAVVWHTIQNSTVVEPDISAIPEGVYHLLVRARDGRGLWSHPADLPFMVDRTPPKVAYALKDVPRYNGKCLTLKVSDAIAPPVPNTLRLSCLGETLDLATDNGTGNFLRGALEYEIDWVWLLRKQLAAAKHGDVLPLTVDGITDAAGNNGAATRIDITLDLESDQTPPTILPYAQPKNTLELHPTLNELKPFFNVDRNIAAQKVATPEGEVLEIKLTGGNKRGMLQHNFAPAWDPDKFQWLALSWRTVNAPGQTHPVVLALNAGARRPRGIKDAHTFDFKEEAHLSFVTGDRGHSDGQWHDLLINVRDFMRQESEEHKDTPDLSYLTLYLLPNMREGVFQIRALAVLAPWDSDHFLPLKAYDLNSIKGLVWSGGETTDTGIRPANLILPKDDAHWFRFRIGDRRGNLTDTWLLPIPPDSQRNKPALPGLEPVALY